MLKHLIIKILIVILVLVADMLTKFLLDGSIYSVIDNFFSVYSTYNYGVAWGMFDNMGIFIIIASSIMIIGILLFDYFSKIVHPLYSVSIALILAGGIGNLFDRLYLGYVRDMLKFDFINFPIFNVADMSLTIGVVLLITYFIISEVKRKKDAKL